MTRKSRRELSREVEDLKPESETASIVPFGMKLENGEWVTPDGKQIPDSADVAFAVPNDESVESEMHDSKK